MADDPKKVITKGPRVGDFTVRVVPKVSTSNALDTETTRERARRAEEDERAARFGGAAADQGEAEHAAAEALAAVDKAIEDARARLAGKDEDVPVLLRDPVTGLVIKHRSGA